ncbi:uncharacterized protein [Periplaneta americana]|uniref:uncharacterized protein n=1 Tax=Periplaneta americana TaxID=6978 RepID=UPI0037E7348F
MACWGTSGLSYLGFLLLAVFQTTIDAYISVDMSVNCVPEGAPAVLQLQSTGYRAAAILELNVKTPFTPVADPQTGDARCRLELTAPEGHQLIVHLDHLNLLSYLRPAEKRQGFQPCFLKVSQVGKELDDLGSRTVDLCDGNSAPRNSLFMGEHLAVSWSPPDPRLAQKMVTKRLIITAVGRWPTVCSAEQRTFCVTLALCIPTEMVCDGFHNCPLAGDDEDPDKCDAMPLKMALSSEEGQQDPRRVLGFLSKAVLNTFGKDRSKDGTTTPPPENKRHSGFELTKGMLRDMSDLLLKQLLSRHRSGNTSLAANSSTSTTTARPPWKDVQTDSSDMGSIPAALAHYGPWGYLMLGMLICGAVLMLCGLWECCCRSSKHRIPGGGPVSTSAATTVFIINSAGGIGPSHRRSSGPPSEEPPPTPGPPSYEELDQPPPYSSLFPLTKIRTAESLNEEDSRVISGDHI